MKSTCQPTPTVLTDPALAPAALLRGAALYLTRHGWTTGWFFDVASGHTWPPACSIGAINIAAHGRPILSSDDDTDDTLTDAAIRAMRVLAAYLDPDYGTVDNPTFKVSAIDIVGDWNDDANRTLDEVIQALNDAADHWDRLHHIGGAR